MWTRPCYVSLHPTPIHEKLTQALHNVLGPIGPLLHSGVSVAPHPRHLGVFLSPFILCAERLLEFEDELGLSGTDAGSGFGG